MAVLQVIRRQGGGFARVDCYTDLLRTGFVHLFLSTPFYSLSIQFDCNKTPSIAAHYSLPKTALGSSVN